MTSIPVLTIAALLVKSQNNADCSDMRKSGVPQISSPRTECESLFTQQFFNAFEMQFIFNGLTNGFWYLTSTPKRYTLPSSHECQFLVKHRRLVFPHLPCSLDLVPCNFLLFPRLKITLGGRRYQDVAETQLNKAQQLQAIPRRAYHRYIEKCKYDWNHCIKPERSHSEGDNWVTWKFFYFPTINSVSYALVNPHIL